MSHLKVLTREEVSTKNQGIFDNLEKAVGFVPNIYAAMANSENALANYLPFSSAKTSFTNKEKEVIDLAVSEVNNCRYCQSAHTAIAKMNGFNNDQIIEFRKGGSTTSEKYNVLAQTAVAVVENRGKINTEQIESFFAAGYTKENLVDLILAIASITVTNYFHNVSDVAIDFPLAPELEPVNA